MSNHGFTTTIRLRTLADKIADIRTSGHGPVYRSGSQIVSNNDSAHIVPNLGFKRDDYPTGVSDILVCRQVVKKEGDSSGTNTS